MNIFQFQKIEAEEIRIVQNVVEDWMKYDTAQKEKEGGSKREVKKGIRHDKSQFFDHNTIKLSIGVTKDAQSERIGVGIAAWNVDKKMLEVWTLIKNCKKDNNQDIVEDIRLAMIKARNSGRREVVIEANNNFLISKIATKVLHHAKLVTLIEDILVLSSIYQLCSFSYSIN
ncbi:hypothetical protein ACH5RR_013196 [Cinchona calisaya]|uniref:RNase H type-1 domain-containing protein n=1 Tax=Cinchona calisaya TaxID=153742 RepID=A0ABD3A0P1_9GENT